MQHNSTKIQTKINLFSELSSLCLTKVYYTYRAHNLMQSYKGKVTQPNNLDWNLWWCAYHAQLGWETEINRFKRERLYAVVYPYCISLDFIWILSRTWTPSKMNWNQHQEKDNIPAKTFQVSLVIVAVTNFKHSSWRRITQWLGY